MSLRVAHIGLGPIGCAVIAQIAARGAIQSVCAIDLDPQKIGKEEAFMARVRKNYPNAQIYCAIGPMMGDWGPGTKPLTTLRRYLARIVDEVHAKGDSRVEVLDFGTQDGNLGFGADWHPNIANHGRMATRLIQTLHDDLGWEQKK